MRTITFDLRLSLTSTMTEKILTAILDGYSDSVQDVMLEIWESDHREAFCDIRSYVSRYGRFNSFGLRCADTKRRIAAIAESIHKDPKIGI